MKEGNFGIWYNRKIYDIFIFLITYVNNTFT